MEACYCGGLVDVEAIRDNLSRVLSPLNSRVLDEAIGVGGALIEDLIQYSISRLPDSMGEGRLCSVKASWGLPPRSVEVTL
ncbi:MAG: hypothetical protein F7C09_00700 [Aeropyrum sp.]|nr:hypothetical protein [Aeropyrum sp.]